MNRNYDTHPLNSHKLCEFSEELNGVINKVAHIPICVESVHRPITCIPFYNHGSYHRGTEIWFPQNMTSDDTYQICRGFPKNEDIQCSNSDRYYDIFDHLFYFGHHVSDYGVNNCTDPVDF
ncbi:unnamed protein product [Caenorhabditis angaria]|uniref:Uncharacterized protein n=1 Tax=Caenorhabditis angaria TaxID=860376 RepID=A0A9P1I868_9PELO|nr:unnamed protein product [Caenorhabditis angaria]